jgi:SET domain-containing protein
MTKAQAAILTNPNIQYGNLSLQNLKHKLYTSYYTVSLFCGDKKGAIFSQSSCFLNHSCRPNVKWQFKDGYFYLWASKTIKKGKQLFVSYIDEFAGLKTRQESLLTTYNCRCPKCKYQISKIEKQIKK